MSRAFDDACHNIRGGPGWVTNPAGYQPYVIPRALYVRQALALRFLT